MSEHDGSIRAVFPPPLRWPARLGLPFALGILIFALVAIVRDLPTGIANARSEDVIPLIVVVMFNVLFLSIWLTVMAFMLYRLLFNAAGRELIVVDAGSLTFRREMPLLTRVRTYPLFDVRGLRATHTVVPFFISRFASNSRYACDLFGFTGGVIAFEFGGRTIRVGGGIDVTEAKQVVARIVQRFPSLGTTSE